MVTTLEIFIMLLLITDVPIELAAAAVTTLLGGMGIIWKVYLDSQKTIREAEKERYNSLVKASEDAKAMAIEVIKLESFRDNLKGIAIQNGEELKQSNIKLNKLMTSVEVLNGAIERIETIVTKPKSE